MRSKPITLFAIKNRSKTLHAGVRPYLTPNPQGIIDEAAPLTQAVRKALATRLKKTIPIASIIALSSLEPKALAAPIILEDESFTFTSTEQIHDELRIIRGELIVDAGARLYTYAPLNILGSRETPGIVRIINGSAIQADGPVYVAPDAGGENVAALQVTGEKSKLIANGGLTIGVGSESAGYMEVLNKGSVNGFSDVSIGSAGGSGMLYVMGSGTLWTSTDNVQLGAGGEGSSSVLKVSDKAIFRASLIETFDNNSAWIVIGDYRRPTSAGQLDVNDIKLGSPESYLVLSHLDDNYSAAWNITGQGSLYSLKGTTELSGQNSYSGDTVVENSTLRAGSSEAFSQNSRHYVRSGGVLDLNGISQTVGGLHNAGTIYFNKSSNSAGTSLTVNGDYHGSGGTLIFNSALAADDSLTDSLHIKGNADGGTNVTVKNLGGQGANTIEGIRLISVDGQIAPGTEFRQTSRIVAGAYDYRLVQGGQGGSSKSWYLTSGVEPVDPPPPIDPSPPIDPLDPPPVLPAPPEPPVLPEPPTSVVRPEAGSYMTNLAATNEMFVHRLDDRTGEREYIDEVTGEKQLTTLWLRAGGGHEHSRDQSDQLENHENHYVLQLGGQLAKGSFTGEDGWHLGMMMGYGNSSSDTRSSLSRYDSKGNVDGYSVGVYGTWFQDERARKGAYVDTWLQHAWFDNRVDGDGLAKEDYNSKGLQASLESGYTFEFGEKEGNSLSVQPQAQVIWSGIKTDDHREDNGSKISAVGEDNVHTRLGIKLFKEVTHDSSGARWTPSVAANWHYNSKIYGVEMDDVTQSMEGVRNTGEVRLGMDGALTSHLSVSASISGLFGEEDYSNVGGFLGLAYRF